MKQEVSPPLQQKPLLDFPQPAPTQSTPVKFLLMEYLAILWGSFSGSKCPPTRLHGVRQFPARHRCENLSSPNSVGNVSKEGI
jgi:hypothetical protein